ncbi:anion transporter [Nibricoccus aquaticus]|uniref:Anion transporter n=1 Tax=Nibricoccus aquaticus TaxID=2576891 RepID=A0A290QJA9_9BACT|nr:DASS family sodium-coupled anion symporter [Nibricoccus aquaticus]ATC65418.1 anion transporter [Nibricoccus aquaticus]
MDNVPREQPPHSFDEHVASSEGSGWPRRVGLFIAVLLLAAIVWTPAFPGLTEGGTCVALLTLLMGVLWITEAIPIPATALLPLVLLPLMGIAPIKSAAMPYADPIIFLFMGGFMLALAMERWNLHRRIALTIIGSVGTKPRSLVLGFLCAAAFLSMWTSNSATAMMLLPIGVSVYGLLKAGKPGGEIGAALMLAIAYGANIGGMGTLIGTPPNAVLKAYMEKAHGVEIGFGQWMLFGVPVVIVSLPLVYWILTRWSFLVENTEVSGVRERLAEERSRLGRMNWPEWAVTGAFVGAVTLWISRELWKAPAPKSPDAPWPLGALITDEVIAMGMALLLFFIPAGRSRGGFVLDWTCMKKMPWDVLILFGGGLSLAAAMEKTGLVAALATALEGLSGWPPIGIVFLVTAVMIVATALTSNTATATAFLPVIGALAIGVNQPPLLLCVPVAFAASADFALPVGTPPNAIAYGSGLITLPRMLRAGLRVDLLFALLLPLLMWTVGRWVFGL